MEIKVTRKDIEKSVRSYARQLEETPLPLSKMKKDELQAYKKSLLTRVMIKEDIEEAEWLESKNPGERKGLKTLVAALIQENKLTSEELYYWNINKFVLDRKPASEYISVRYRASIWTQYADASIVLNEKLYEVKNVQIYSETNSL